MELIGPRVSFREYAERARKIPDRYFANRYYLSAHGVGLTGEFPCLYHLHDSADAGYDGVIEPGMTICVESHIGEDWGSEGVKLGAAVTGHRDRQRAAVAFPVRGGIDAVKPA